MNAQISQSSFPQLACILRVSSPRQLELTSIFELANHRLATLFPGGPNPFTHLHRTEYLEEGLELALRYEVESEVLLVCSNSEMTFTDNPPTDQEGTGL